MNQSMSAWKKVEIAFVQSFPVLARVEKPVELEPVQIRNSNSLLEELLLCEVVAVDTLLLIDRGRRHADVEVDYELREPFTVDQNHLRRG